VCLSFAFGGYACVFWEVEHCCQVKSVVDIAKGEDALPGGHHFLDVISHLDSPTFLDLLRTSSVANYTGVLNSFNTAQAPKVSSWKHVRLVRNGPSFTKKYLHKHLLAPCLSRNHVHVSSPNLD
jgi:hypothetical protein